MIIARQNGKPQVPRLLQPPVLPPAPEPEQAPTPPGKGEVFLRSSGVAARKIAQIGGFTNGASFGYLGGALAGAAAGLSGPATWASALAVAGVGGVAGYKVMGRVSDWAGRTAARLSPNHPLGAEVAGRVGLNLAVDLLGGSPLTAAVDLTVTAGYASYKALRAPSPTPKP